MATKKDASKNVYVRLAEAREIIANTKIKKKGRNNFSKYDYFTPEQITQLAEDACRKTGLITIYNLEKNELEHFGTLKVVNVDSPNDTIVFRQTTAVPEIKATNLAQKIGGTTTYNSRYLTMTAFAISDNSLDFDAQDNRPQSPPRQATKPTPNKVAEAPSVGTKVLSDAIKDTMLKFIEEGKGDTVKKQLNNYAASDNKAIVKAKLK
jgi:hypothetical protein